MKALKVYLACFVAIAILVSGAALTYAQKQPEKIKVKIEMKSGDEVTLFYGGGGNIKDEFPVGETMGVYSRNKAFGLNENVKIGKVKILGYGGDTFVKAQVVEGTIGPGDVVKLKPGVGSAGMVAPPTK
jgi:hypothetical protein